MFFKPSVQKQCLLEKHRRVCMFNVQLKANNISFGFLDSRLCIFGSYERLCNEK